MLKWKQTCSEMKFIAFWKWFRISRNSCKFPWNLRRKIIDLAKKQQHLRKNWRTFRKMQIWRKFRDQRTVQRRALGKSRRELSNKYSLAKFGFDAAENEPYKVRKFELSGIWISTSKFRTSYLQPSLAFQASAMRILVSDSYWTEIRHTERDKAFVSLWKSLT